MSSRRTTIGVVGAGIIGLTAALKLSEAGHEVVIVARDLPGDDSTNWASPWAGAIIMPWKTEDMRDRQMQLSSLKYYWALAHSDPTAGVQTVNAQEYWDESSYDHSGEWYATVFPNYRRLQKSEIPPGTSAGSAFSALSVNPEPYLLWLRDVLARRQVRFIRAVVESFEDAKRITGCTIIVNASGLGAGALAKDKQVVGIRGQTMLVDCPIDKQNPSRVLDREVRIRRGTEYTYVLPRMLSGCVIIGGIEDEGNTSAEIDPALQEDILRRVNQMTGGWFQEVTPKEVRKNIVGIRPGREGGYRLEREGHVVHAYGFGGAGYRYSVGAAEFVTQFVDQILKSDHKL